VRNNYRLVDRYNNGRHYVRRDYLIDYGGRWGHAPTRYNGHNFHFCLTLRSGGFYLNLGYSNFNRRYYGDGWDLNFGWSSRDYLPIGYQRYGTYYFEPCYAFSYTFNHGYERGYLEGYLAGVRHWNAYTNYNSAYGFCNGYASHLGPYNEYMDGYSQGYSQGYYAAYAGQSYGYMNYGFGDFANYPVIYDFDYHYYDNPGDPEIYRPYGVDDGYSYDDDYYYDDDDYYYNDDYNNEDEYYYQ
jgi:hypothetical protein